MNPFRKELLPNDGYVIDPHGGRNGTPGLVVSVPGSWYGVPVEGVQPMQKYKYGVWIKTKDLVPGVRGATMFLSFMKDDGSWSEGDAPLFNGFIGTQDWTYFEQEVTAPAKFHHVMMNFYIGHGKGEAVFSEPFMRRDAPTWASTMVYPPMRFGIEPGKQTFEFNSYAQNINDGGDAEAKVVIVDAEGKSVFETQVPVASNRYSFDADLPEGVYQVKMTLLPANLKSELKIKVVQPRESACVRLDGRGRFIVDGKPFLPVGLYTNMDWGEFKPYGNKWREYDTKTIIEESPFNVILPYDGLWWKLEKPELKGFAATQHMLDVLQKNNKKLILSVKDYNPKGVNNYPDENLFGAANITKGAVERFRDHPALLAWYVNDERDVEEYEREQVDLIGLMDPYHPTIQVQFRPNPQFYVMNGGDIIGLDLYPIRNVDSNQKVVCDVFESVVDGYKNSHGIVLCAVPQMFSWHAYSERIFKYKPTLEQMRAVTLMMAIYGTRSFIFYAHQGLAKMVKPFEMSFEELWKEGCELAQTVRDLEDYLLGDPLPFTPECEAKSGNPVAQVLTSNAGKQAVMITTVGDTKTTDAIIQLDPNRNFRSKYGKTKALGEGKYQFTCEYLDCDVLVEEP